MKYVSSLYVGAVVLAFSLVGCATAKFDADKTKAVKKLAILAIEIQQQQPKDALGAKAFNNMKARLGDSFELQNMAKTVFANSAKSIQKKTGWQVVGLDTLQTNPVYSAKVKSMMEGFRTTSMAPDGYEIVALKGTLDAHAFRKLKHAERVALAKSLGADAFAVIQIYQSIDQGFSLGNLTGDAPFQFTARSNMDVYDSRTEEPIWRTQNVDGVQTASSESLAPSLSHKEKLSQLGSQAAESSINKLVESYKN